MVTAFHLTIVIALMQIPIIIIPLRGKIYDGRRRWNRRITKNGYGLLVCCTIVALSSIWLFKISQDEQEQSQLELNKKLEIRDSLHQVITAREVSNSTTKTIEALAEYGLKYDQTRDEIIKIAKTDTLRPSIIPEITISSTEGIILDTIVGNEYAFSIKIQNNIAPANNIRVKLFAVGRKSDEFYLLNNIPFSIIGQGISMNLASTITAPVVITGHYEQIIFYFTGTFRDSQNKKFNINKFFSYHIPTKHFGVPDNYTLGNTKKILVLNKLHKDEE